MKNVGDKLRLFLCLSLVLICAFFTVCNFTKSSALSLFAVNTQSNTSATETSTFDNFANAIAAMKKQYAAADNAIIFLDKEEDLSVDNDGNYLITEQKFTESTGVVVEQLPNTPTSSTRSLLRTNVNPTYNLNDLAEEAGYDVTTGEYNMVLTRPFGIKRLLIYSATNELDLCGAVSAVSYKNFHVHQYDTEAATCEAYNYYLTRADVDSVDVDSFCWVENAVVKTDSLITNGTSATLSYDTWGAEKMGVPEYSEYLLNTASANDTELPEIVVAVLDTGIDTDHPYFTNRLLTDENGKYVGYDLTGKASSTEYAFEDDHYHGTHCAGIVCDMTLPNVKILPIKFMQAANDGAGGATGETSDAIAGMYYAIEKSEEYNIVAINMSFGHKNTLFDNLYSSFNTVIANAAEHGIFCVVSAGNDKTDASKYSPASNTEAITVSALNTDMTFASDYSNYGSCVDVCAPGTQIISAYVGGERVYMDGTSMAAPHIAAYIALLESDQNHVYSMNDIKQILSSNTDGFMLDLGDAGKDDYYGYGLPILTGATPQPYTVNHYFEAIYELDSSEPHQYELRSEVLYGFIGESTAASAKNYAGFTPVGTVKQQTITLDEEIVIEIYYTRNQYNLTINQAGKGITEMTVNSGEYLYGQPINLNATLDEGYQWFKWQIDICEDANFTQTFVPYTMDQTIKMPASDLVLTGYAQQSVYLITIKVKGKGEVTPQSVTVYYGEGMTFEFRPEDGYALQSVSHGDSNLELTEVTDGVYVASVYSITENTELSVVFKKNHTFNWADLIVWGGGSLVAVILFGSSAAMLIIAFRDYKPKVMAKVNNKTNGKNHTLSPENRLMMALEYISGREIEFINFCYANQIDYKNQYRQAVLKFYDAAHRVK